jgi:two-component sensor histidine kinase
MLQMTQNRIRSMAMIHQTLYQSKDFAEVDFHAFLQSFVPTLIQSYSVFPDQISLNFHVAELQLPIDAAIPCGLIVNELISNALKHAFPEGRPGKIDIDFSRSQGDVLLSVRDDGVGLPVGFSFENSETLGVQLVSMLAGQLQGNVTIEREGGTEFQVRFPLTN